MIGSERQARKVSRAYSLRTVSLPRLLICSSSEGLSVAEAIEFGLRREAECTVWTQGFFRLSLTSIENLVNGGSRFDFAVIVLTPDDRTTKRGLSADSPRDTLIYELGFLTGKLGLERTFVVHPDGVKLHLPSYLSGLTAAMFAGRSDGNLVAALGPACTQIKMAMRTVRSGNSA